MNAPHVTGQDRVYLDLNYNPEDLQLGWMHIGFGKFARTFIAYLADQVARKGNKEFGLVAVTRSSQHEGEFNSLRRQNMIYHLMMLNSREVCLPIGAVRQVVIGSENNQSIIEPIATSSVRLITMTVTKNGYHTNKDGTLNFVSLGDDVEALRNHQWSSLKTVPGWVLAGLYQRHARDVAHRATSANGIAHNVPPIVMSCDNVPANGPLTRNLFTSLASEMKDSDFADYVANYVVYPNTTVDRITPDQNLPLQIRRLREDFGRTNDQQPFITEEWLEMVVEDDRRLPQEVKTALASANVKFVEDIEPYQARKIGLLNGAHLLMGLASLILRVDTVQDAMKDREIRALVDVFCDQVELGLSSTQPEPISDYRKMAVHRFENPRIPDRVDRLNGDTLNKVIPRLLNTPALEQGLDSSASAFAIALWLRYLTAIDDSTNDIFLKNNDTTALKDYGLERNNPEFHKNLIDFLTKPDSKIPSPTLHDFATNVEKNLDLINQKGLRNAICERFALRPDCLDNAYIHGYNT